MPEVFDWNLPPLSADDERLIEAYKVSGRPVDDLAYTEQFEQMIRLLGVPDSQFERHVIYRRLLTLRKMGRLPRPIGVL